MSVSDRPAPRPAKPAARIGAPPVGTVPASFDHHEYGAASGVWTYRDGDGNPIFWIRRFDPPNARKQIVPLAWDLDAGRFVAKQHGEPRPLYGLDLLRQRPTDSILVVEGEKTADAARVLLGKHYVVITWSGGSQAWSKTDWTPLHGRKVLLLPDADAPGVNCMGALARQEHEHWESAKIVDTTGMPDGWDVADGLKDGWDTAKLVAWAKPRAKPYPQPVTSEQPERVVVTTAQPTVQADDESDTDQLPGSVVAAQMDLGLAVNSKGTPHANLDNMARILKRWEPFRNLCWWDTFHQRIFTGRGGEVREWTEKDDIQVTQIVQRDIGIARMGLETVRQAIHCAAMEAKRDEPRDWMSSLTWDGKSRIERFCPEYLGSEDSLYSQSVGRNFFVAMVARTFDPGCKVDNMLVLEGLQGARKSTALQSVGGKWFAEVATEIGSQKFIEQIQGKLLVEIAELDSLNKADVSKIKQAITCQIDRFRPSYGRYAVDYPRRCIFTGSTNEDRYLRDATGARRFWPIKCARVDYDRIRADREQMFAEAVALYQQGAKWYEMPSDETAKEQESRRMADAWEEPLGEYLSTRYHRELTISTILFEALEMDTVKQSPGEQRRAAACMRVLGWHCEQRWSDGKTKRVWVKTKR